MCVVPAPGGMPEVYPRCPRGAVTASRGVPDVCPRCPRCVVGPRWARGGPGCAVTEVCPPPRDTTSDPLGHTSGTTYLGHDPPRTPLLERSLHTSDASTPTHIGHIDTSVTTHLGHASVPTHLGHPGVLGCMCTLWRPSPPRPGRPDRRGEVWPMFPFWGVCCDRGCVVTELWTEVVPS